MAKHRHVGSSFDDWLKEEGILEEVEASAAKRTFVIQLEYEAMAREPSGTQAEGVAKRLQA